MKFFNGHVFLMCVFRGGGMLKNSKVMSLFKGNYDLKISMQLIWEFKIYIENKINFYDEQITNNILFLLVKEMLHDLLSSIGSLHTLRR